MGREVLHQVEPRLENQKSEGSFTYSCLLFIGKGHVLWDKMAVLSLCYNSLGISTVGS